MRVEPTGIEPVTSALRTQDTPAVTSAANTLTKVDKSACTAACTGDGEPVQGSKLEALAAELMKLSVEDRKRLASMLLAGLANPPGDGRGPDPK